MNQCVVALKIVGSVFTMGNKIKGGIVPDRVELGFWQLWKNYLKIGLYGISIGFIVGVGLTAVLLETRWIHGLLGL
jgi:hypothetical protein